MKHRPKRQTNYVNQIGQNLNKNKAILQSNSISFKSALTKFNTKTSLTVRRFRKINAYRMIPFAVTPIMNAITYKIPYYSVDISFAINYTISTVFRREQ